MSNINSGNQMEIGERLREFRVSKDLRAIDFAKICEISQGSLSGLENGKSYPSAETLINLIRKTDIDIEWLLTGKGRNKLKDISGEQEKKRKFEVIEEIEEWLTEETRRRPKRESWFEIQMLDLFPAFREWKRKRDEKNGDEAGILSKKIA